MIHSIFLRIVVLDTTKVQIFKQITTSRFVVLYAFKLFQIPQRYRFSSKSQPKTNITCALLGCFRYHKGTDFQANHNLKRKGVSQTYVVLDTTKVQIFKQITTNFILMFFIGLLFQIPQRYRFSSKSQHFPVCRLRCARCFRYHKGTDFQANHNSWERQIMPNMVVLDTTKVQIFKQITTLIRHSSECLLLFQIPQRYRFSSKSQQS